MKRIQGWIAVLPAALLAACGGSSATYTVSASVTGLVGSGLVLQLNGSGELPVAADGMVAFGAHFEEGAAYTVTAPGKPMNPSQTCTVAPTSGTLGGANVVVAVSCITDTFPVRVSIAGVAGTGVTLQLNGAGNLSATSAGVYEFTTPLIQGASYAVTVLTHPVSPFQECTVAGPDGTMPAASVTLSVTCVNTHILSGTVSGLSITRARTALVLTELGGGGQDVSVNSDGSFAFVQRIPFGRAYVVAVKTAPGLPDMDCTMTGAAGTMPDADLDTVNVSCERARGKFAYMGRFPNAVLGAAIASNGTLSTIESLPLGFLPRSIAVDPSGQFLYVSTGFTTNATSLSSFRIHPGTGQLAQVGSSITNTYDVNFLAVEPRGRFLFSSNQHGGTTNQGSIAVFAIDPQTGQLSEVPGSPFDAPLNPFGLAFDATGQYVYTAGEQVRGFSIDQTSGGLAPVSFVGITGARRVIGTPDGRFLYVRGQSGISGYLKAFRILPNGGLQEFAISVDISDIDDSAAMDPKGRFVVYFASNGFAMKISVYEISTMDGTLSRLVNSPGWVDGSPSFWIPGAFDPSGSWLFVNRIRGQLGITHGTATFQVGDPGTPLVLANASAYDSGDTRAIVVR